MRVGGVIHDNYIVHVLKNKDDLEYVDMDDEPNMATENEDIEIAFMDIEAENATMYKIPISKRSEILTEMFGIESPIVNSGTTLLLDRSCVYFEKGFKANYFKKNFEQLLSAVNGMSIEEFSSYSKRHSDIRRSLVDDNNVKIAYRGILWKLDDFIRDIEDEREYYIGYVFGYRYNF